MRYSLKNDIAYNVKDDRRVEEAVLDDYQPDYLGRSIQGLITPEVNSFKHKFCLSPKIDFLLL